MGIVSIVGGGGQWVRAEMKEFIILCIPGLFFFCKLKFLISIQPNAIKCHIYIFL